LSRRAWARVVKEDTKSSRGASIKERGGDRILESANRTLANRRAKRNVISDKRGGEQVSIRMGISHTAVERAIYGAGRVKNRKTIKGTSIPAGEASRGRGMGERSDYKIVANG